MEKAWQLLLESMSSNNKKLKHFSSAIGYDIGNELHMTHIIYY